MHPFLTHHNHFLSAVPYVRAFRGSESAGGAVRNWFRNAYRRWQRNMMVAAFESLDDRTLRDIGVHRGEIHSIVEGFDDQELRMVPVIASDNRS